MKLRRIADLVVPILDFGIALLVIPSAWFLKMVRRLGLARLKRTRSVLLRIGMLPINRHYYEPLVVPNELKHDLGKARYLPGIDLNESGQLMFLNQLTFESELGDLTAPKDSSNQFRLGNGSFESGDAEFLYQMVRFKKPSRIYEIGSGNSTLIARAAIKKNGEEDASYRCQHICIEPYEASWLEDVGVEVVRRRVEDVDPEMFGQLGMNDILFVDSSHVIRPQGDVLTEYLQIIPSLRQGVIVHVHDIFTPRDYPSEWVVDSMLLWNEQYLLEAFLSENRNWTVIGAVNYLKHNHFGVLKRVCPYVEMDREPGSFYMQRN